MVITKAIFIFALGLTNEIVTLYLKLSLQIKTYTMSVILSIIIAIAGFLTACFFTYKAFSVAKKSAEDKISHHNKPHKKYMLAK